MREIGKRKLRDTLASSIIIDNETQGDDTSLLSCKRNNTYIIIPKLEGHRNVSMGECIGASYLMIHAPIPG